ncbi:FAD:protein FMN transferase [Lysobacter sp. S4-A87]|uniref:FAD:protein FMN transferase n=1 Tax=Lysobacter sp. S4-A87 TaxID=2925843 RepID=UPI001F53CACE|nr:FAD:protein FMN transferase [Lysobacter sp. S4-A87]UNK50696.1 FAD:protein FMN transferase [Lysobacter sp. S4-A87]
MQAAGNNRGAVDILGGATMGTTWSVKLVTRPHTDLHALHSHIQARLDGVVAQMSNWTAHSDLSRFNAAAAGSWHALQDDFWTVLSCALDIARSSGGAYDPTLGALVDAWGFGPSGRHEGRHDAPVDVPVHVLASIGWQRIVLDHGTRRVLQPGGTQLDLCAIAKGYAADAVAAQLLSDGIDSMLVEVGGELYGRGHKPDGSPWRVIVEACAGDEDDANEARVLALDGRAVATSGDRWHRVERDGQRYSHTIDPRSGRPARGAPAAVTVAASNAMLADGWATALTVMGAEAGHAFACEQGLAARFVVSGACGQEERMTPAFAELLQA